MAVTQKAMIEELRAWQIFPYEREAKKVQKALLAAGERDLASKIARCARGKVCCSHYCRTCRAKAVVEFQKRLRARFETDVNGDPALLQQRWYYLTILCAVVEVDGASTQRAVEEAREGLYALKRKFPDLWMQGAFEFELVPISERLNNINVISKEKAETLWALLGKDRADSIGREPREMIHVHLHAVVDLVQYGRNELRTWMRKKWNCHPLQVQLKATRSNQFVDEKIKKIASYGLKNRLKYNGTFSNNTWEFGQDFTYLEAGRLIKVHHDFMSLSTGSMKSFLIGMSSKSEGIVWNGV